MNALGSTCRSTPREDGFVLIGVVIFVLALTILGLSLFSLSGYEVQFLGESRDRDQAFYLATGGIERAKFALVSQGTLQSVKSNLPFEGVTYARARYTLPPQDSSGNVVFSSGRDISIRVLAFANGQRRMVETRFRPRTAPDFYKRLVTATTGLVFPPAGPWNSRTFFSGDAMQMSTDTTTWTGLGARPRFAPRNGAVIPIPAVGSYFQTHFNDPSTTERPPQIGNPTYVLHKPPGAPQNEVAYFKTTAPPLPALNSLHDVNVNPVIDVKGLVVWMFDRGVRFDNFVTVTGNANDCLVIVAQNGSFLPGLEDAGIYFFAGISSDKVPVILVTDSIVRDEQFANNTLGVTEVGYLSIFASQVLPFGPFVGGSMTLTHDPNSPFDQPGGLIDQLYAQGALPNPSVGAAIDPVRGQWAELNPDNPPN
jgi:hypothetical protein